MSEAFGKRCSTCIHARDLHIEKGAVESRAYLTCWRDLPHECRPWNRCDKWEYKEVKQ